jgi:NADPH-dependent F420 reductase
MRIAILGGTGKEGQGLGLRWTRAGHAVVIGSRDAERARARAKELSAAGAGEIGGNDNVSAVGGADAVVVAVPYTGHGELLKELRHALESHIVIDITVPLKPPRVREVHLPPGGAAALEAQEILGQGTHVAAALQHVSSVLLSDLSRPLEGDVLVCSDHDDARSLAIRLVGDLGMRGLDAGPLRNAVALEALTPVLLYMNRRYKVEGAGIRVAGLPEGS